ncbi:porin [Oxalobacter sp. OttesenSCG-928-P03]|nr:porin [Oxalobacter sp. OttesenSCG-928-P03]
MKKKLLALAVLGAAASMAQAQSNVQIYGTVDTGYIKESGTDLRMGENATNLIGFRGFEDLGGGLKATFELEKHFSLQDGSSLDTYMGDRLKGQENAEWLGAANLGLEGDWGKVRFGRISEISYEYFWTLDPFEQGTTGASLALYNRTHSEQLSNTFRYDSPEWSGLGFSASFTLSEDDRDLTRGEDRTNYGFGGSIHYDNGPLVLMVNYNRLADSNDSWVWNIGGGYEFGPARVTVGYQSSKFKKQKDSLIAEDQDFFGSMDQEEWLAGLTWDIGPGQFKLSYNRASIDNFKYGKDGDVNKYAMGYTYNLSKRTSIYGVVSYTDSDNEHVGSVYNNNETARESVTGFQLGMTHNF